MNTVIAIVIAMLVLIAAPRARACDTEKTATPQSDCVVMPRAGVRGVWFELQLADDLRATSRAMAELGNQVRSHQELMQIRDYQLSNISRALAFEREAKTQALSAAETFGRDAVRARQERDEALRSRSAWYRSPLLWTGVGLVAGLVGGVAVTSAF